CTANGTCTGTCPPVVAAGWGVPELCPGFYEAALQAPAKNKQGSRPAFSVESNLRSGAPIGGRQATPTPSPRSASGVVPGLRNQFEKLKKKSAKNRRLFFSLLFRQRVGVLPKCYPTTFNSS